VHKLARHGSSKVTDRYTRIKIADVAHAVERLPAIPEIGGFAEAAEEGDEESGTDGEEDRVALDVAQTPVTGCLPMSSPVPGNGHGNDETVMPPPRLERGTSGLAVRCRSGDNTDREALPAVASDVVAPRVAPLVSSGCPSAPPEAAESGGRIFSDSDLARLVAIWPELPKPIRRATGQNRACGSGATARLGKWKWLRADWASRSARNLPR
jgi:hypothetical protein